MVDVSSFSFDHFSTDMALLQRAGFAARLR
jgi:hypothetical protein